MLVISWTSVFIHYSNKHLLSINSVSGLVLGTVSKRSMNKIHRYINESREPGDIEYLTFVYLFSLFLSWKFLFYFGHMQLSQCLETCRWVKLDGVWASVTSWIYWVTFEESLVTSFRIFQDLNGISHSLHFLGLGRGIWNW